MVESKIHCEGVDFSSDSVQEANRKLAGNPFFHGAAQVHGIPTHLEANSYDVVFCLETVEHILRDELRPAIQEMHRVLRPGGFLVVTTPNDENLSASHTMCPECGAVFHMMQHVNSWNISSLSSFVNPLGFRTVSCGAMHLHRIRSWARFRQIATRIRGAKAPNLVYIGQKIAS